MLYANAAKSIFDKERAPLRVLATRDAESERAPTRLIPIQEGRVMVSTRVAACCIIRHLWHRSVPGHVVHGGGALAIQYWRWRCTPLHDAASGDRHIAPGAKGSRYPRQ
ncbi:hypothetical protein PG985_010426 [Apiospora marii]|uniref:Uncharacterized protein n=1 Tax=Apiospora marii TaxID=335849 RepID=A0ABR1RZ84_9PEZI